MRLCIEIKIPCMKSDTFGLSAERANLLLGLYTAARATESVVEATQRLTELWSDPATVFDHLLLLKECPDPVTRDFVCLSLRRLIGVHFSGLSPEQVLCLRDALLERVSDERQMRVRYHLCDAVVKLLCQIESEGVWSPVYEAAMAMMKVPEMLSTGIYLVRSCFSSEMWFPLLSVAVSAITSAVDEDRIQSILLIQKLLDSSPEGLTSEDQIVAVDGVLHALLEEIQTVISAGRPLNELQSAVNVVCSLIEEPPNFIGYDKLMPFVEMASAILSNSSIPMETRCIAHMIISSAAALVSVEFSDRLVELIKFSIELSCEMCASQRDDRGYEFPFHFFFVVASSFDENVASIFEFFMKCVVTLVQGQSMVERQVAMFVLKAIVEGTQEIMSTQLEDVLKLIFQASTEADEFVISAACQTIDEIVDFLSGPMSVFVDNVTSFLFQNISNPDAIRSLDLLFYKCDRPPQNLEEVVHLLVSLIPKSRVEQIELIIGCISSSLSRLETPNESIFATLTPILNQILAQNPELRGAVLEFFGRIARVSPASVRAEMPKLVEFGTLCLTSEVCDCYLAGTAFGLIAQVLPVSLSPFIEEIVPNLIVVLQMKGDDMVESQLNLLRKSQNAAIVALATFVGYMPDKMTEYAQSPILEYLMKKDDSLVTVSEAIGYAAEGFAHLGISLDEFITSQLMSIHAIETKDSICALLVAFAEIICVYGDRLSTDIIAEWLRSTLVSPGEAFVRSDNSRTIDQQVQMCLFHCIGQFIDALGRGFTRYADAFIEVLHKHFTNTSPLMRGHVIMTAAHICRACGITSTIYQMTLNHAIREIMELSSIEPKRLCAKALKWLVMTHKDAVFNRLSIVDPFSLEIMSECEYFALWATLAMSFNQISNQEALKSAISLLPPPPDSEDVVLAADFAVFVASSLPDAISSVLPSVAIALFSSSDKHLRQAKPETIATLAGVLKQIPEPEIVTLCKNNEHAFTRVLANMMKT